MELIIAGRPVDAEESLGIGLANEVVPEGPAPLSMFGRTDSHSIGAGAFKQGRAPEWRHHGL